MEDYENWDHEKAVAILLPKGNNLQGREQVDRLLAGLSGTSKGRGRSRVFVPNPGPERRPSTPGKEASDKTDRFFDEADLPAARSRGGRSRSRARPRLANLHPAGTQRRQLPQILLQQPAAPAPVKQEEHQGQHTSVPRATRFQDLKPEA